jgi:hypothetical protein
MTDSLHVIADAIVGGAIAYLLWRFRYMEMKMDTLTDSIGKAVTLNEHRESMRGVYSDVNLLRERVARMEGPAR